MGIETVGLVVAAVGAAAATYGTIESQKAAKNQGRAQKEASEISAAQQKNEEARQRREQIRQQRIRIAQVEQGAASAGVSGSSGEAGAVGGIQTVTGDNISFGKGTALAAQGISAQNQRAADAGLSAQINQGIAGIGFNAVNLGVSMGASNALFGESSSSKVDRDLDNTMKSNPSLF